MARTSLTPNVVVGPYPTLPVTALSLNVAQPAADTVNLNQASFGSANALIIIARNSGASAYTITITSRPDGFNRTGDITTYSIGASLLAAFKVERAGWAQSDGNVYFEASNASVLFTVLAI